MTALYHRRFFFDVNFTTVLVVALLVVGWWDVEPAFLLVPVVALMGAVATAFDASYLIFARWYAAYLERYLDDRLGERILVGAELEDTYLFGLGTTKVVTIPLDGGLTWFSFMTVFYTVIGALAYVVGIALGWDVLLDAPAGLFIVYLVGLVGLTFAALVTGMWWFVGGEGERRLRKVLDERFPAGADHPRTAGSS